MGFYATESVRERPRKTYLPSKKRVGGFSETSPDRAPLSAPQTLETQWENAPTSTTTASGVCFYGYRFYNPELGRWLSRDPIHSPEPDEFRRHDDGLQKQVSAVMQSLDQFSHDVGISIPVQSRLHIEGLVRSKIASMLQRRDPSMETMHDLYVFCNSSPINSIDPLGLMPTCTAFSWPCWGKCPRCCLGYLGGSLEDHENSPGVHGLCLACEY